MFCLSELNNNSQHNKEMETTRVYWVPGHLFIDEFLITRQPIKIQLIIDDLVD